MLIKRESQKENLKEKDTNKIQENTQTDNNSHCGGSPSNGKSPLIDHIVSEDQPENEIYKKRFSGVFSS